MKKKNVMISGAYFAPDSWPMLSIAMSWRTQSTSASIAPAKPRGAWPSACAFRTPLPAILSMPMTITAASSMNTTCLVGERSIDSGPT